MMDSKEDARLLIARAKRGDRAAFEKLAGGCRTRLESVVRFRLKAPLERSVEVDDLVQETLLRAFGTIGRFEGSEEEEFLRWLSGIAVNVVLEAASRHGRQGMSPIDREVPAGGTSPSGALRRNERFDRLQAALNGLSPEYREVLLLVRVEGLAIGEVAKRMNRSPNAVSKLLLRASRKLRADFGDTDSLHLPDRQLRKGGEADAKE